MLLLLACCGLPLAAQAGGSDADRASAWLLHALVVVVGVLGLLFAAAFATRLLVWPRFFSFAGILAVLLLVGFVVGVAWVAVLLATPN